MAAPLVLDLPFPPSVNHYWRRHGSIYFISTAGKLFRNRVAAILASGRIKPLEGPIAIDVEVFPPDRRRRDIDNLLKAPLDALQHAGVYADDNQIADLRIRRKSPLSGGGVRVTITQTGENLEDHVNN